MSGKETIIERILSDAETKAEEIIADANSRAESIYAQANENVSSKHSKAKQKAASDATENLRRRMSVAGLDAKKSRLYAKQKLLEQAFVDAGKAVVAMDDKTYCELIGKLITRYAADGENVIICENDSKRITQTFLNKFDKNLKLAKNFGDFEGGIILAKGEYEKNLTLDVLLDESRERVENKVATVLFKENL
ncbi:MAG TPA: V-type ATP synthase subunit E family protein [Eubacteriales bacterium]|nr:V-type ATP synthase subunit E family protein [Eubacteriales bacterium]